MYNLLKNFSRFPLAWIQRLAKSVGMLLYVTHSSARRVTELNLATAYPELSQDELNALSKRSLISQCQTYAESVKIWGSSPEFSLKQIQDVHGAAYFHDSLASGRGVIAVIPHFGTWEIMNAWVNQHTTPVIMYKPEKNADINRFMLEARQRLNATLVPTDDTGVRAIFKHLKQGGFTAILPDHVPKASGGIYAPFFGQSALSTTLVSKLAAKTQCALIGMSCLRRADGLGFDLHIVPLSDEILSKDLQVSVTALNQEMERMINVAPEQYLWTYKRFRDLEGGINLYKATSS